MFAQAISYDAPMHILHMLKWHQSK